MTFFWQSCDSLFWKCQFSFFFDFNNTLWLIDWLIHRLIGWLIDWLVDWLIGLWPDLVDWLIVNETNLVIANDFSPYFQCIWCHSTGQCLPRSALNVALAFGQCRFWENNNVAAPCAECREIKDCDGCLARPLCGWCSQTSKDPRQGVCLDGSSSGSEKMVNASTAVCGVNDDDPLLLGNSTTPAATVAPYLWSFSSCPDVDEVCRVKEGR